MKISRKQLIKSKWFYVRKVGRNCEIWGKDAKQILWNKVTFKVYMIQGGKLECLKERKKET